MSEKKLPATKTEWADIMHDIYMNKSSVFPAKKPYQKIIGREFLSKTTRKRIRVTSAQNLPVRKGYYRTEQVGFDLKPEFVSYYELRKKYIPV